MTITYYGQICIGVEIGDSRLLFDPFISGNPLAKQIDVSMIPATHVLLTHGHGDHVADAEAILNRTGAVLISNAEICDWYGTKGIAHLKPMNIGGRVDLGGFQVKSVMAQHSSTMPDGASGGSPGGFVIFSKEGNFHHAGDTALMLDMQLLKRYELRFATAPHENRASNTQVTVRSADGDRKVVVNQKQPGKIDNRWVSLGTHRFVAGKPWAVEVSVDGADGNVHIDAVQALPVE